LRCNRGVSRAKHISRRNFWFRIGDYRLGGTYQYENANAVLNPIAPVADVFHGGDKNSRSSVSTMDGMAWKEMSAWRGSCANSGMTSDLSYVRRVQYRTLIKTSSGVVHMESKFLTWNKLGEDVKSARRPETKVRLARVRPMMVRYWKCQP